MTEESNKPTFESTDEAKIHSLYIKPSSWERLGLVKRYLNLSYTETIDLLVGHLIQEELLPKELVDELKDSGLFRQEDKIGLEINGIYGRYPEAALSIEELNSSIHKIERNLEILTECIEDHAEAIIMKDSQ
jgi:hypothetical protein